MTYVEIPLPRLALTLALVVLSIAIARKAKLDLERELAWGSIRAAIQLVAIGYALTFLFAKGGLLGVVVTIVTMLLVAAWTSARRIEHGPGTRVLYRVALSAITIGALVALVPVFAFVVRPTPWFSPQYVIPLAGMMIANAMNVVALVLERLFAAADRDAREIEQLLALGASPKQALATQTRAALRAALTPTINGLVTVGLVALPGMMTGQIMSGTAPQEAVRYQLVVMYQLVTIAAVAGMVASISARRLLFTPREQLRRMSAR